jgi:hypothetical protein
MEAAACWSINRSAEVSWFFGSLNNFRLHGRQSVELPTLVFCRKHSRPCFADKCARSCSSPAPDQLVFFEIGRTKLASLAKGQFQ